MDDFARLSPAERAPYIRETAVRMNVNEVIVEKDFWVCWTLKQLFSLKGIADHLIFKGGTSLSKCYDVIHRFSEDIDVSISRDYLGFPSCRSNGSANWLICRTSVPPLNHPISRQ